MHLSFVDDAKHFVPAQVTLVADGVPLRTLTIPHVSSGTRDGTLRTVDLRFDPVTAKDLRLQVDSAQPGNLREQPVILPVSIAEVGLSEIPVPASPATIDTGCRTDLVSVDDQPFPVAIRGASSDARRGLEITACTPAVPLRAGSHRVDGLTAATTGFDVDRVVLSSDRAGQPVAPTPAGAPISASGARIRVTSASTDSYHLEVQTDGTPFWLVLGQSHNDGWEATVDGRSLGAPTVVNGFGNGWTVRAQTPGTLKIVLRWTPQRAVWIGLAVSGIAVLVCVALVFARRRRARPSIGEALLDRPTYTSPIAVRGTKPNAVATLGAAVAAGVVAAFVSRWWIGLIVAAATALSPRLSRGRLLLAAGAPVTLALGAVFDLPELGWVAIGLLIGDLVAGWWWERRESAAGPEPR
jgi:hypothetical protein